VWEKGLAIEKTKVRQRLKQLVSLPDFHISIERAACAPASFLLESIRLSFRWFSTALDL
jgi:hypothetical protein